ncbi:MAG TPA: hypothetical protein ENI87_03755 [bacterium]|nr:hypothetical protein [bacterium]
MKRALLLLSLGLLASCGSVHHWRELQTDAMPLGEAWNGFVEIVTGRNGFATDYAGTDRGNGVWLSRWKRRELAGNYRGRIRLRGEFLVDDGSTQEGWLLRYYIEREKVEDLRRHRDPREEDYSADGQDTQAEEDLYQRLVRRLSPTAVKNAGNPPTR